MNELDLKFVADTLLSLCEAPPDAPFLHERKLVRRQAREEEGEVIYVNFASGRRYDELMRGECMAIFEQAKLTERQRDVVVMKLDGWTFQEIAESKRTTKQSVHTCFLHGIKKLRRALHVYPYTGLSEVYRAELKRGHSKAA
ncbi:MAG TPA: sigma factor-like helix-turn-helix DNA-binding protein [Fimbriimonadaceae bacterium]|nr:sigma factor-like helix-turn-helix DNA-binding protein [Fimbriimonadaceae bacterium]